MKNYFLLFVIFIMFSNPVVAQIQNRPLFYSKGNSFGKLSFSDLTYQSGSIFGNEFYFTGELSFGHFLVDRIAIGATLKSRTEAQFSKYSLGVYSRYYLIKNIGLFGEVEYEGGARLFFASKNDLFSRLGLSIGYTFIVGKKKRVAIELKDTYFLSPSKKAFRFWHSYSPSIGVVYYFFGKQAQTLHSDQLPLPTFHSIENYRR